MMPVGLIGKMTATTSALSVTVSRPVVDRSRRMWSGGGLQGDGVAEGFELVDEVADLAVGVEVEVGAEVAVVGGGLGE
jgi:hypothetical protein